jgi:hypothetical protein
MAQVRQNDPITALHEVRYILYFKLDFKITMPTTLSADDAATLAAYLGGGLTLVEEATRDRLIAAFELAIMFLRTPIETARKNAFLTLDQALTHTAIGLNLFSILTTLYGTSSRAISTTKLAVNTTPPCPPTLLREDGLERMR